MSVRPKSNYKYALLWLAQPSGRDCSPLLALVWAETGLCFIFLPQAEDSMTDLHIKRGDNWHGMIVKFQYVIGLMFFCCMLMAGVPKEHFWLELTRETNFNYTLQFSFWSLTSKTWFSVRLLPHCFKHSHIDMNTLLQSLKQQSSWQDQELTDKLHSKRVLAQQPLLKSTKSHMPHW